MNIDSKVSNILININGEVKNVPQNITILELIEIYKLNLNGVVIELNNKILKKEFYNSTTIKENDKLEIVTFVGGG